MRIRKRFPSFPIVPSSVASSTQAQSQQEEMEVFSFPVSAEGTAREASPEVLTDWQAIMARAHRLLGCSSSTCNCRTVRPCVQEEHSSTSPVSNGETVTEIQSRNGRNKSLLEQENPSQTMAIERGGGNSGKQILDLFSNSQKKGNYSATGTLNCKGTTVSSSSWKGDAKGIFPGNSEEGKAETAVRMGGNTGRKGRTKARSLMEVGSSRCAWADGSSGTKSKDKAEAEDEDEDEECSSIKKRSLTSIYADIRSLMPSSSNLNQVQEITNGKALGEEISSVSKDI